MSEPNRNAASVTKEKAACARYLPGLDLPTYHPLAGRGAWQCVTCDGIFFPQIAPPVECPYCAEGDDE